MIDALLKYQEVDAKLNKIDSELSKSEERQKFMSARKYLEGVSDLIAKLEQKSAELSANYNNIVNKQNSIKEQITEFHHSLEIVEDEAGASFLLKKADELFAVLKSIEEETSKIETEMKNTIKEYVNVVSTFKKAKEQYAVYREKYVQLKDKYADERKSIIDELEKLKKDVEPSLMERYLKKREDKIFPVLFEVKNGFCGACGMEVPSATDARLKAGEIIECDQCRRLMYIKG